PQQIVQMQSSQNKQERLPTEKCQTKNNTLYLPNHRSS
ncbi:MAG: hypothetical protein ACI8RD_007846, partial [Bacillariaceae sp.]